VRKRPAQTGTKQRKVTLGDRPMVEDLRDYLGKWRGHWQRLSRETGVSFTWIQRVYNGTTPGPGLDKVETILRHRDAHGDRPPEHTPWTVN
jgi:hypothetical protein